MTDQIKQPPIHLKAGLLIVALGLLAGCAQAPEDIAAAYISQSRFQDWSCEQLVEERGQLVSALTTSSVQQQQARDNDIAGIILLGLPVGSLSGGNVSAQIARLKGERNAVERTLRENGCGEAVAAVSPLTSATLKPQAVVCGPLTSDAASRPELKTALARYYKRNPLQRNFYGSPARLESIEKLTVADISGNLMTVKVQYRARKVHFGIAKVEACGSAFKVLSFS